MKKIIIIFLIAHFLAQLWVPVLMAEEPNEVIPSVFVFLIYGLNSTEANARSMPFTFGEFKETGFYYSNLRFTKSLDFHVISLKGVLKDHDILSAPL